MDMLSYEACLYAQWAKVELVPAFPPYGHPHPPLCPISVQAENTGLGGKRFLQSFEHPARRGPSPLSPKDINAVKPKTAPSLRDKLKGYAEAKVRITCWLRGEGGTRMSHIY
jgi:hypothetical protein